MDRIPKTVFPFNDAITANHPHFTQGRSRAPSLNVDAFDFMIGQDKSDFPDVFAVSGDPISVDIAKRDYEYYGIAEWLKKRISDVGKQETYYLFYTEIGRTIGNESQVDYLVIATEADKITAWEMFADTLY